MYNNILLVKIMLNKPQPLNHSTTKIIILVLIHVTFRIKDPWNQHGLVCSFVNWKLKLKYNNMISKQNKYDL